MGRAKGEWKERNIRNLICRAFLNPFSVTLLIIAIFSGIMEIGIKGPDGKNGSAAIIIGCMVLISGSIRMIQEIRSQRAADRLEGVFHSIVHVWRNGKICMRPAEELVVGDYRMAGSR